MRLELCDGSNLFIQDKFSTQFSLKMDRFSNPYSKDKNLFRISNLSILSKPHNSYPSFGTQKQMACDDIRGFPIKFVVKFGSGQDSN
jgi:hypothetical protein